MIRNKEKLQEIMINGLNAVQEKEKEQERQRNKTYRQRLYVSKGEDSFKKKLGKKLNKPNRDIKNSLEKGEENA